MARKDERFVKMLDEGSGFSWQRTIWVDRETGVNYLWVASGYAGGLTVLLDRDGKPVVSSLPISE